MNYSNNETDGIYFSKDFWLTQYVSTWLFDSIYLFAMTPIGLIGFVLNLLSFYVLMQKEFDRINEIYVYFRVITINSAILNLLQASLFTSMTYRYLEFTNSFEALTYGSQVYLPVTNLLYLFGSCLDICISLQRCSIFIAKLKVLLKYPPKFVCLALFLFCFLINFAYFFVNVPSYFDAQLGPNTYYRIWFFDLSSYGKSLAGQLTQYVIYSIKDLMFLIIELFFNILSIVLFKKYLVNKSNRIITTVPHSFALDFNNSGPQISQQEQIYIKEKNMTLMVIIMCALSILVHLIYLVLAVYFSITVNDYAVNYLAVAAFLMYTLKNFANFPILYMFNINFRKAFKKHVLKKKNIIFINQNNI
jgi:hypothetical protein